MTNPYPAAAILAPGLSSHSAPDASPRSIEAGERLQALRVERSASRERLALRYAAWLELATDDEVACYWRGWMGAYPGD